MDVEGARYVYMMQENIDRKDADIRNNYIQHQC